MNNDIVSSQSSSKEYRHLFFTKQQNSPNSLIPQISKNSPLTMGQTFSYLFMNNINFINKKEQSKEKYAMRAITSAYLPRY